MAAVHSEANQAQAHVEDMPDIDMWDPSVPAAVVQAWLSSLAPPRPEQMAQWAEETDYSDKYCDEVFEYRRVTVPVPMVRIFPLGRCMTEEEWRSFGITMSRGWEHYDNHLPERHVLLFRRVLGTDPKTGLAPPDMAEKAALRLRYIAELEHQRQLLLREKSARQEDADMF
uniref:Cyclin-dependent kinases regulatory subunit n=1 Tax=Zooxanthella nutricula TaxID=1333877 RepID=A0A7S2QAI6_9DINO